MYSFTGKQINKITSPRTIKNLFFQENLPQPIQMIPHFFNQFTQDICLCAVDIVPEMVRESNLLMHH